MTSPMLTKRQKELVDYLDSYISKAGYAPTLEEIGQHFGLSSLATIHKHLTNLERKGMIRRNKLPALKFGSRWRGRESEFQKCLEGLNEL